MSNDVQKAYNRLADGIILQAVYDYVNSMIMNSEPVKYEDKNPVEEIDQFFDGEWFKTLDRNANCTGIKERVIKCANEFSRICIDTAKKGEKLRITSCPICGAKMEIKYSEALGGYQIRCKQWTKPSDTPNCDMTCMLYKYKIGGKDVYLFGKYRFKRDQSEKDKWRIAAYGKNGKLIKLYYSAKNVKEVYYMPYHNLQLNNDHQKGLAYKTTNGSVYFTKVSVDDIENGDISYCEKAKQECKKADKMEGTGVLTVGKGKLSAVAIRQIRRDFDFGDKENGARALGRKYGINVNTVLQIVKGEIYKWVK